MRKLSYASAMVCDNLYLKSMIARLGYDVSKVHVIYNGVDLNVIRPNYSIKNPKTVLFLSYAVNKRKGFRHFIEVSKNLKSKLPNVRFAWVGQKRIKGDSFSTIDYVWDKRKFYEILRSSYLLLMPSLWPEAMSYSVIQAMAAGKPVVAYDVGANSEAIIHGENGFLAQWGNVNQMTSLVETLLNDEDLASRMGKNARKKAEQMFSLDKTINTYNDLIREVML